jgi:hypothetical protein
MTETVKEVSGRVREIEKGHWTIKGAVLAIGAIGGAIITAVSTTVIAMLWLGTMKTDIAVLTTKQDGLTKDVGSARQDAEKDIKNLKESLEKDIQNLQRSIDRIVPPQDNRPRPASWSGIECFECPYDEEQGKFVRIDDVAKRIVFQLENVPFETARSLPIATDARIIEKGETRKSADLKSGDEIAVLVDNKRAEVQLVEIYKLPKPPPGSGSEFGATPPGFYISARHFSSVNGSLVRTDKEENSLTVSVQAGKGTSESKAPIADGSLVFVNGAKAALNDLKKGMYIVAFYDTETRHIQLIRASDDLPEVPPLDGQRASTPRDLGADGGAAFSPLPTRQ